MSDLSFLKSWIQARGAPPPGHDRQELVREFEQFFAHIFDTSRDGIGILDLDFTILGVNATMERWFAHAAPLTGRKCYEVYHGGSSPCENCPTGACCATGRPQTALVPREAPGPGHGTRELSMFPMYDDGGRLFCLIEHVRSITDLGEEERAMDALRKRVKLQDHTAHDPRVALEALLRSGDHAERRAVADVLANVASSVSPVIARLKDRLASSEHLADIELLERQLSRITSPLIGRLAVQNREFTPREREIASLIAEGRTSKEIAERLCLTVKAVDFHRMNLRRKLHMGGCTQSLQGRLLELEQG